MAVLISEEEVMFQFPLPGDNETNRIEALEVLDTFTLAVIANTTVSIDSQSYEMSLFTIGDRH